MSWRPAVRVMYAYSPGVPPALRPGWCHTTRARRRGAPLCEGDPQTSVVTGVWPLPFHGLWGRHSVSTRRDRPTSSSPRDESYASLLCSLTYVSHRRGANSPENYERFLHAIRVRSAPDCVPTVIPAGGHQHRRPQISRRTSTEWRSRCARLVPYTQLAGVWLRSVGVAWRLPDCKATTRRAPTPTTREMRRSERAIDCTRVDLARPCVCLAGDWRSRRAAAQYASMAIRVFAVRRLRRCFPLEDTPQSKCTAS
ncbi:hypothetical protein OH77DRAFT_525925 [Trametes cingulata]|nr:hypothetical protein OH77DRAFT_525925 [Trametes cingulata]